LDKLGADNCIDPDDFEFDDLEDDMFKNLEAQDIIELFTEKKASSDQDSDSPFSHSSPDLFNEYFSLNLFHDDNLLTDDTAIEDLQFMDTEQQLQNYEALEQ
jgi:hypothetical protein